MAGFLETQSNANQTEAVYIAYFTRAADGGGYLYWTDQFAANESHGLSPAQSAAQISQSFAVQPEATAEYAFLASPPAILSTTDPTQIAAVDSFIIQVYQNLFNRTVTASDGGVQYWQNQILSGHITVGEAVYAIGNGATGADATVLGYKISAATAFTSDTFAANVGASAPLSAAFISGAKVAVTGVVDATTEATSVAASAAFAANAVLPNLTLTPGVDTLSTGATGAVFNAGLVSTPLSLPGVPPVYIAGGSNANLQTLTVNDSLIDTAKDGTLNATFDAVTSGTGVVVQNVTLQGISTANLTVVSGLTSGFEGNVTGLTTVNSSNSNGGVQLGVIGAGLHTALTNVNVTGFTGANSSIIFAGYIAAAAGAAANTINVSISGLAGDTGFGLADKLIFGTDGVAGTKASPALSYGTWALTANSDANLQLQQHGVGGATTLTLAGAGSIALGEDAKGNWQKLTKIDASASTGNVTITGHAAGDLSNVAGTGAVGANPFGLFGSAAGLLDGNTSLTSYLFSTGVNVLDVSSLSTPALLGALTTTPGSNTQTTNEIIVTSLAADTTVGATFAGIKGFQILGVTGAGGDTGTIDYSNLPSTIDDIVYQTASVGALTINNLPTSSFTVDTEDNGLGNSLTVTSVGAGSLNVIVGNATTSNFGWLGDVILTGEQTVTFTAQGPLPGPVHDWLGTVSLTPASLSGNETVTIAGSSSVEFGHGSTAGAIVDLIPGVTPAALNVNNLAIDVTDTGVVQFDVATTGVLTNHIVGNTSATPFYSTNALTIDAHASGGLVMQGGDANFSTLSNTGDHIIGSLTAGNVLIGSIGNDVITGTSSTTAPDTITTGGGADTITLAAGHTASDLVELYAGASLGAVPGVSTFAAFGSIVDPTDHAQLGWWGIGTNGTAAVPVGAPGTASGTSNDLSTVAHFAPGTDAVAISSSVAWSGLLHDISGTGTAPTLGSAQFSNSLTIGGAPATTAATTDVLLIGTPFASAATLANALEMTGLNFTAAQNGVNHYIVAYQDLSGNTRIADLDVHFAAASTTTKGEALAVSDLVDLTGVSLPQLHASNIHFTA
jgi:hypothetical protein